MTFIEFFDKTSVENICTCLAVASKKVIMLGPCNNVMADHKKRYETMFHKRNIEVDFQNFTTSKSNLKNAVEIIERIVNENEDCVFDITGGEPILNIALGIVFEKYKNKKNIQIHRFNILDNKIVDCDMDGKVIDYNAPSLSVEENIAVYGGAISFCDVKGKDTYRWDLNEDFRKDIDLMWELCKQDVTQWNVHFNVFDKAEKCGRKTNDGLTITADVNTIKNRMGNGKGVYRLYNNITSRLLQSGLLTAFSADERTLTVTFKNHQVKRCLVKAGQVLEMKIFVTAKELKDETGKPVYNDVLNGVSIDWDSEFHNEETDGIYDTENEIDVMLMHNMVPVFVSCKNGTVKAEELYKLATVANRFGGKYAKKVIIVNRLDENDDTDQYIIQRAKDMNIRIISRIQEQNDQWLQNKLRNL